MDDDKRILKLHELLPVQEREIGEEFVVVQQVSQDVICRYKKKDMEPYVGDRMLLRATVARRLMLANRELRQMIPGAQLCLVYAYRHPEVQRNYFETERDRTSKEHPKLQGEDLFAKVHKLVADPRVAGHPTGAAVDVTIVKSAMDFDMGTFIADFADEKIETYADGLTGEQRANRELLRGIMMRAGFAPFNGEWWHFSYGDREWAAFYGLPHSLYSQLDIRATD